MKVLVIVLLLVSYASAQTHQPTFAVEGDTLRVEADIAWINTSTAIPQGELILGTPLMDQWQAAETEPGSGIAWKLVPGSYQVIGMGRPDDYAKPQRVEQVWTVTIVAPGRIDTIKNALDRITLHGFELAKAYQDMVILKPTQQELRQASK